MAGSLVVAASVGYGLGSARQGSFVLSVQQRVPFETYLSDHSFSEIENTKDRLEALSLEFVTDVRAQHDISVLGLADGPQRVNPLYAVQPERAIDELQQGIQQFKGSEQEMRLIQELLCLLKKQKLQDRWLNLYLGTLYEHPTDPLVSRYLRDALAVAESLGRHQQLTEALDLLRRIPLDFPAKAQAIANLDDVPIAGLEPLYTSAFALPESPRPLLRLRQ